MVVWVVVFNCTIASLKCIFNISWRDLFLALLLISWVTAHLYNWKKKTFSASIWKLSKLPFQGFYVNPHISRMVFQQPVPLPMKGLTTTPSNPCISISIIILHVSARVLSIRGNKYKQAEAETTIHSIIFFFLKSSSGWGDREWLQRKAASFFH